MGGGKLRIKLIRSLSGQKPAHRKTVEALGLRRVGSTVEQSPSPAILGMLRAVAHMVRVEESD
jgi:large subunit ribosomal protein L30